MTALNEVRHTRLRHLQCYDYRTHLQKCDALCTQQLGPLGQYLLQMHDQCPLRPFLSGPRSSAMRYQIGLQLQSVPEHPRSRQAAVALRHPATLGCTPHDRVQRYMLQHDPTTISVEVPVWVTAQERGVLPLPLADSEFLTGHIDLLAIENGRIVVWDFKPRAAAEKFAVVQVALYAYMLSVRTGLPLDWFRCGYFDDRDCLQFVPTAAALAGMQ